MKANKRESETAIAVEVPSLTGKPLSATISIPNGIEAHIRVVSKTPFIHISAKKTNLDQWLLLNNNFTHYSCFIERKLRLFRVGTVSCTSTL